VLLSTVYINVVSIRQFPDKMRHVLPVDATALQAETCQKQICIIVTRTN